MIGGQRFDTLNRIDNQLRHTIVVWAPGRMIDLTDCLWEFRIRHSWPIELALEDNKHRIAIPGSMPLRVRPVRQSHKFLPESMCL